MTEVLTMRSARVNAILQHSASARVAAAQTRAWAVQRATVAPPAIQIWDRIPDGAWRGQRCFIVGGGPSLKGFDFGRLRGERVIAVNKSFYDVPFADIMFAMDRPLLDLITSGKLGEDYRAAFESFYGAKLWLDLSGYSYPPGVYSVRSAGEIGWTKSLREGLYHGQNSGYGALNLALILGAGPIYLLGYDCSRGPDGEKNYHNGYPTGSSPDAMNTFLKAFEAGAEMLRAISHSRIVNLNPNSALRCFEFGDVDKALPASGPSGGAITVITPTGDRPLAFALCQRWMARQTVRPGQWIVIDDGKTPLTPTAAMQYVRREPRSDDPQHTLVTNLKAALPMIKGDKILIMEDDEYYAPGYIEEMARRLDTAEVVGICQSRYYHVPSGGYYTHAARGHASLAQTAFRASFLPEFTELLKETSQDFLDIRVWKRAGGRGALFVDDVAPLYVGMKGLPGRAGIGAGHTMKYPTKDTADRAMLKKWIPRDYQTYLDVLAGTNREGDALSLKHVLVDIIVPTYENEDLTVACFESLKLYTDPAKYRLIWVDNASKDTSKIERCLEGVNYIQVRMPTNVGFVGAVNRGLELSNSDYVCLLNNDTVLSSGWLDKLLAAFSLDPALGIVGPVTAPPAADLPKNYDSHHNIRFIEDHAGRRIFPPYSDLETFNRHIEVTFSGVLADCAFVAFLCAVIRREVIDKIGLLDTNYACGMYDDNDYNLAARKAGYKTQLLYSTCIYHRGRSTFNMVQETEKLDVGELLRRNHAYLQQKWGKNV